MRVLIRADADENIGTGHLTRCLTLARALSDRGADCVIASRPLQEVLRRRVIEAGCEHIELAPFREAPVDGRAVWPDCVQTQDRVSTEERVGAERFSLVIVDHYGLSEVWESGARSLARRIVAIDDLANRRHDCDVLLDQNWGGSTASLRRYEALVPDSCRQLIGPRYALLASEYRRRRARMHSRGPLPERLVVSFGGADPTGETSKMVEALDYPEHRELPVDVVIGAAFRDPEAIIRTARRRPGTTTHISPSGLAKLFSRASLAAGLGGSTTWERICLGIPSVVATSAPGQVSTVRALEAAGALVWAGSVRATTSMSYSSAVGKLREHYQQMAVPPLVDGWGAERVSLALLLNRSDDISVSLRPALVADRHLFLGAAGHPAEWEQNVLAGPDSWLSALLEDSASTLTEVPASYVMDVSGVPSGALRVDRSRSSMRISVAMHASVAHLSLVPQVLRTFLSQWMAVGVGQQLDAELRNFTDRDSAVIELDRTGLLRSTGRGRGEGGHIADSS